VRLLLVHHFFQPDDVVSARLYSQLAAEQAKRGWDVTVLTSNRACRRPDVEFARSASWPGVHVVRAWRPPWTQASPLSRLANSGWLLGAWLAKLIGPGSLERFDAVIVGTDPAFAPLLLIPMRAFRKDGLLATWTFDLYPEAITAFDTANDVGRPRASPIGAALVPLARRLMRRAYASADLLANLGTGMAARLAAYEVPGRNETFTPWSPLEPSEPSPPDPRVRARLFPGAELGLLYAGTLGRAHDFRPFLELSRRCRARSGNTIGFAFACGGHRRKDLERALGRLDTNVRLIEPCPEQELLARLEAADMHLVSVRDAWEGIVMPTKFFGALAVGRPVLYAGPPDGDLAERTRTHDVGFTLTDVDEAEARLHALLDDRRTLTRWGENAWAVYRERYARSVVNDRIDAVLRGMLRAR
jgi:hypothetical protein